MNPIPKWGVKWVFSYVFSVLIPYVSEKCYFFPFFASTSFVYCI